MVLAGGALHGDDILALWETISTERWRDGAGEERADSTVLRRYREAIVERHKLERPVRVVVVDRRRGHAGEIDGGPARDLDRGRVRHPHVRVVRPVDVLDGLGHDGLSSLSTALSAAWPR